MICEITGDLGEPDLPTTWLHPNSSLPFTEGRNPEHQVSRNARIHCMILNMGFIKTSAVISFFAVRSIKSMIRGSVDNLCRSCIVLQWRNFMPETNESPEDGGGRRKNSLVKILKRMKTKLNWRLSKCVDDLAPCCFVVGFGVTRSNCFWLRVELVAHALPGHVLTINVGITRCLCADNNNQHDPLRCFIG